MSILSSDLVGTWDGEADELTVACEARGPGDFALLGQGQDFIDVHIGGQGFGVLLHNRAQTRHAPALESVAAWSTGGTPVLHHGRIARRQLRRAACAIGLHYR